MHHSWIAISGLLVLTCALDTRAESQPETEFTLSAEERCTIGAGLAQHARIAHDKGTPEDVYLKDVAGGKYTTGKPDAKVMRNVTKMADWAYHAPAGGTPALLGEFVKKHCLADLAAHPNK